jgi:hypothetical protein
MRVRPDASSAMASSDGAVITIGPDGSRAPPPSFAAPGRPTAPVFSAVGGIVSVTPGPALKRAAPGSGWSRTSSKPGARMVPLSVSTTAFPRAASVTRSYVPAAPGPAPPFAPSAPAFVSGAAGLGRRSASTSSARSVAGPSVGPTPNPRTTAFPRSRTSGSLGCCASIESQSSIARSAVAVSRWSPSGPAGGAPPSSGSANHGEPVSTTFSRPAGVVESVASLAAPRIGPRAIRGRGARPERTSGRGLSLVAPGAPSSSRSSESRSRRRSGSEVIVTGAGNRRCAPPSAPGDAGSALRISMRPAEVTVSGRMSPSAIFLRASGSALPLLSSERSLMRSVTSRSSTSRPGSWSARKPVPRASRFPSSERMVTSSALSARFLLSMSSTRRASVSRRIAGRSERLSVSTTRSRKAASSSCSPPVRTSLTSPCSEATRTSIGCSSRFISPGSAR